MKTRVISFLLILTLLSSCALFQNVNTHQGAILVKAATRTGTVTCLTQLLDNKEDRVRIAGIVKNEIANTVIPILGSKNLELNSSTIGLLFEKVPFTMRPFLKDAVDILIGYKVFADDVLSQEAAVLIKAFFQGIIEGCDLVLGGSEDASVGTDSNQPTALIHEAPESS
jgi:hypothetical protein